MKLIRKSVTKVVDGQERTYVNVILVSDNGMQIPIKSSFANDARLLKSLAVEE